jgi:hypothetical protein
VFTGVTIGFDVSHMDAVPIITLCKQFLARLEQEVARMHPLPLASVSTHITTREMIFM